MSTMNATSGMNMIREDSLITRAIVGTGKYTQEAATGTPADTLLTPLSVSQERKLLLAAGAAAIYQRAGRMAMHDLALPEPAPIDTLPTCSPRIVPLLQSLLNWEFGDSTEWLVTEVVEIMRQRNLYMPYELLPFALNHGMPPSVTTAVIALVIGVRGRWLSQFNKHWFWVEHFFAEAAGTIPADAEMLWQEGTAGQRRELLRRLRTINTTQAREWLMEVWKQEKADVRAELISSLEVGLSLDDEPFLEQALEDRGGKVRATAASFLAHLPTSAYAQRMRERADTILNDVTGSLTVKLPTEVNKAWERDGISMQPPKHERMGAGAWAALQVLTVILPTYWEERFQRTPTALLDEAQVNEWGELLIKSWSYAAMHFGGERWLAPLWQWWCEADTELQSTTIRGVKVDDIQYALGTHVPQAVEAMALRMAPDSITWLRALKTLPRPWSQAFGEKYVREQHECIKASIAGVPPSSHFWISSLPIAARALPFTCFDAALADVTLLGNDDPQTPAYFYGHSYREDYARFAEIIRIRKRFVEEIQ